MDHIEDTLRRIVGDHLGIPGVALPLNAQIEEDLGGDSMDRMELIMTVEEHFEIRISKDEYAGIQRISDLVAKVQYIFDDPLIGPGKPSLLSREIHQKAQIAPRPQLLALGLVLSRENQ